MAKGLANSPSATRSRGYDRNLVFGKKSSRIRRRLVGTLYWLEWYG